MTQSYLKQALELAATRRGFCAPNPAVGAVIVKNGQVIATGYHAGAGQPHAEAMAFDTLQTSANGATLYVTLEPCCHHGRTPPCTDRIIAAGIKKVVFAYQDPNPIVAGKGAKQLTDAGIACTQLELPEISGFYSSYCYWWRHSRPFVTAKLALSLDGKIAGPNNVPVNITGQACQDFTHQRRLESDAILTTARTVINDNPRLNVRLADREVAKPLYILYRGSRLSGDETVFSTASSVTIFHDPSEGQPKFGLDNKAVTFVPISSDSEALDIESIIQYIGAVGVHDLWVEAGGTFFSALIQAGLVQRSYLYVAPTVLGEGALPAFSQQQDLINNSQHIEWFSCGSDSICKVEW